MLMLVVRTLASTCSYGIWPPNPRDLGCFDLWGIVMIFVEFFCHQKVVFRSTFWSWNFFFFRFHEIARFDRMGVFWLDFLVQVGLFLREESIELGLVWFGWVLKCWRGFFPSQVAVGHAFGLFLSFFYHKNCKHPSIMICWSRCMVLTSYTNPWPLFEFFLACLPHFGIFWHVSELCLALI